MSRHIVNLATCFMKKVSFALPALGLRIARNRPRPGVWKESVPQEMAKTTSRRKVAGWSCQVGDVTHKGKCQALWDTSSHSYSAPGLLLYLLRAEPISS